MQIAEIGLCHDGQNSKALELVQLASKYGYTAVKFQKRSAGHWFSSSSPRPDSPFGKTEGDHRHTLELTIGEHKQLQSKAHELGMQYGVSVWDPIAAVEIFDILTDQDFLKIGRPSNDNIDLLRTVTDCYLSSTKRPLLVISVRSEVERDLTYKKLNGITDKVEIKYLYCPGNYPDRQKDLPQAIPHWAHGLSLHHTEPKFGLELKPEIYERHIALKQTMHRDKAWSIILE